MLIHLFLTSPGGNSSYTHDKNEDSGTRSVSDIPDWDPDLSDFQSLLLFLYHTANKRQLPPHIKMYLLPEDIYYTPIMQAIIVKATYTKWGRQGRKWKSPYFQASGNKTICIQKPGHIK